MPLSVHNDASTLGAILSCASDPLIVIPIFNAPDDFLLCLDSVLRHTPSGTDILLIDDASTDRTAIDELDRLSSWTDHRVILVSKPVNQGYVRACNDAFTWSGRRDVIIVNSDCIVGPEWYDRLCAAAVSSSQIATVSTLTNHGTILSVPERNRPTKRLPDGLSVDRAAIRVARAARRSRPDTPTAVGHCLFVRRQALDLVGGFDDIFGRGYGEEVDFSQRCLRMGLRNICADDVFVYHVGHASFGTSNSGAKETNDRLVERRYRYYSSMIDSVSRDRFSELTAALDCADAALRGIEIGIDARKLSPVNVGTQSVILGSIIGLHRAVTDGNLTVFVSPDMSRKGFDSIRFLENITLVETDGVPVGDPLVDVIFRPCQVDNWGDLAWLHSVGRRVVINQLDTIAYSNPNYFESVDEFRGYRDLTRLALLTADGTTTVSHFSRGEIERLGLSESPTRLRVIHHGTRTDLLSGDIEEFQPSGLDDSHLPFMLCVGASYHHKNRRFCIRLLQHMISEGWNGRLVFIGPRPDFGDSTAQDLLETLGSPDLRARVIDLGSVSESSKRWLYARAALCVYPSTVEGFGLIPFESARFGTPILFSGHGSLGEILSGAVNLVDMDIQAASRTALHLASCTACAKEQVDLINTCSESLTWEKYGRDLEDFFREILSRPRIRCAAVFGDRDHPVSATALMRQREVLRPRYQRTVSFARRHPHLKRIASPEGSRRQALLRSLVHHSRVRQQRRSFQLEIPR